jgi:predicted dehydrogenase
VGLVGAGRLAERVLFDVLSRIPSLRVEAIVDPSEERRALARRRFPSAAVAADLSAILCDVALDAVVICSPPAAHVDAAVRAIDAGLHVYVEKPLAVRLEDARVLAARAASAGVVTMVGFNYRQHPLVRRLRDGIERGRIGRAVAMQSVFSVAHGGNGWRWSPASGGGALFEVGSHGFDLARWLFQAEVTRVAARVWSRRAEADTAVVELELDCGGQASLMLAIGAADEDRLSILGEEGTVSLDRLRAELVFAPREIRYARRHALWREARRAAGAIRRAAARPGEPSYEQALRVFADAVRSGQSASPDFGDGLRSLEVVEAAMRSAEADGRPSVVIGTVTGAGVA